MLPDTAPVRPGEELNAAALAAWLNEEIEIEQFPAGHSNLVYLIRTPRREYVLRRPPIGPVAPKAHDVAREYRVLEAVHPYFPEAPRVSALCEDLSVVGAPFFLMERRHGIVLRDDIPAAIDVRLAGEAFIDCLERLHAVDISPPEIQSLGKPEGFIERQVRGWAERWQRAKTEEMPVMDTVIRWLAERIPSPLAPTLLHNDFKLDNVMFAPTGDRVEAVLDWEMATIGDPLADLGLTLCYWTTASATGHIGTQVQPSGWFTRDEFVERYARRSGRDVTHLRYYEVLGIFKLAVILQQIYFRYRRGQTADERFRNFDSRVRDLAALAGGMMERPD